MDGDVWKYNSSECPDIDTRWHVRVWMKPLCGENQTKPESLQGGDVPALFTLASVVVEDVRAGGPARHSVEAKQP